MNRPRRDRVVFVAVWTAIGAVALLALTAFVTAAVYAGSWVVSVVFPALDAWMAADPLRPVALFVGVLALGALLLAEV